MGVVVPARWVEFLVVLSFLLITVTAHVSFASFGRELLAHVTVFAAEATRAFEALLCLALR